MPKNVAFELLKSSIRYSVYWRTLKTKYFLVCRKPSGKAHPGPYLAINEDLALQTLDTMHHNPSVSTAQNVALLITSSFSSVKKWDNYVLFSSTNAAIAVNEVVADLAHLAARDRSSHALSYVLVEQKFADVLSVFGDYPNRGESLLTSGQIKQKNFKHALSISLLKNYFEGFVWVKPDALELKLAIFGLGAWLLFHKWGIWQHKITWTIETLCRNIWRVCIVNTNLKFFSTNNNTLWLFLWKNSTLVSGCIH